MKRLPFSGLSFLHLYYTYNRTEGEMKMIYGIPTKKEKLLMKMNKLNNEIDSIVYRVPTWTFNRTTCKIECIEPEMSDKETQQVENLKAELKQLEVELKLIEMEGDFV